MKKIFLIIILVFLGGLIFSSNSFAAGEYQAGDVILKYEGLVPCGKCLEASKEFTLNSKTAGQCLPYFPEPLKTDVESCHSGGDIDACLSALPPSNIVFAPCELCHFGVMTKGIIDFVLTFIVFPSAVLLFVIGGALFVFAAGSPDKINKGRSIMTSVVWGLVIIFAAWLIVNTVFIFLGVEEWTGFFPKSGDIERADKNFVCDDDKAFNIDEIKNLPLNITSGDYKGFSGVIDDVDPSGRCINIAGDFPEPIVAGTKYSIGGSWFQINCPISSP